MAQLYYSPIKKREKGQREGERKGEGEKEEEGEGGFLMWLPARVFEEIVFLIHQEKQILFDSFLREENEENGGN